MSNLYMSVAVAERSQIQDAQRREELHQELPPLFAKHVANFVRESDAPEATLFVAGEDVLGERVPARALVLTADGVLFLEEGETRLQESSWGFSTVFYPYAQITAVGMGAALLAGRFTLHGGGSAPFCEFTLHAPDVERFEIVARLIGEKISAAS